MVAVVEVAVLACFWACLATALLFLRNTLVPRSPITETPAHLGLAAEAVQFFATDGLRLEGWKIPSELSRPWIILCHGLGTNRADLLGIAAGLHHARFNLLLFDFRGHGGSAGRVTSFGWQEQRDLAGALVYLGRQPESATAPYGVYGVSLGGSVAIMVAAQDERLGAIVAEGPYATLQESISRHLSLMYPWLPKIPFLWVILGVYRMRFGVWPVAVSPEAAAEKLPPRPLLLIQGDLDSRMPVEQAERIVRRASGGTTSLWIVKGAGHLEGFALEPTTYLSRVVDFFEAALSQWPLRLGEGAG